MTSVKPIPTAEELSAWPTAAQAYELLKGKYGEATTTFITGRLMGGMITAVSEDSAWESKEIEAVRTGITKISNFMFSHVSVSEWRDLWATGDLRVSIQDRFVQDPDKTVIRYFSVKISPCDLAPLAASGIAPIPRPSGQDQQGPRVSDPHLAAWHALYVKVYGGTPQDTLDNALKSSRGMFPGRSVSRDRVRDLCSGRKAGRKKESSAD